MSVPPPPPTLIQPQPGRPDGTPRRRRLWWHRLILGLWYRPVEVLDEARDRGAWGAAALLCLVSGALGVLSVRPFREQWTTDQQAAVQLAGVAVGGVLIASIVLGVVTHAIARIIGGNGRFSPTASLFIVLFWTTDLPRLAVAAWLPASSTFVQALAWTTWGFGYVLAVLLVRGQHHLPTGKAAAAVTIQMLAALALLKLGPVR
ncbi:Yip1 family protein [Streptomyces sp. MST-110588]|uniref:YIP1 family protein n=1 Tax=Streptomyces sp. MST-110588 TaxID=2833628 RepID=UPI001F5D1508|nr:Yip1 family protein [Streptomyces sp. MST-110588]UNO41506.1 YIP1 family protein [Streptomyces sp. MST-110588]